MIKFSKRVLGVVLTSAILISGALTCSAYMEHGPYHLYSYMEHTLNGHTQYTDNYQYLTIYWPEGKTYIDLGWKQTVENTYNDYFIGMYQDIYHYHDYRIA